jgi:hypothetical protein
MPHDESPSSTDRRRDRRSASARRRTAFAWVAPLVVSIVPIASLALAKEPTKSTPAPTKPAPNVSLTVEPFAGRPWVLTVRNDGDAPFYLYADARLLTLIITPPGAAPTTAASAARPPSTAKKGGKAVAASTEPVEIRCTLPADMRAPNRVLTLAPGASHREGFDPRMHCLDRLDALTEGATLRAELGWPTGKDGGSAVGPYVVGPLGDGSAAPYASVKLLAASPRAIVAADLPSATPSASASGSARPPQLWVSAGPSQSVADGSAARVELTLHERWGEPATIYARPQLLGAEVIDPRGARTLCQTRALMPAPIPDFLASIAPHGAWSASVQLASICPPGTLDRPGVYRVTPLIDAPYVPFRPRAIFGELRAAKPTWLRVEQGSLPYQPLPFAPSTSTSATKPVP